MVLKRQTFRYDAFLSFRGEDTRKTFTSHLYEALRRNKFGIFHDSSLPRGESIAPQLLSAINESEIFIVLFSTNYADSKWCLNELSEMIHCVRTNNQHILFPVYLDVNQSDVATLQGSYNVPFTIHENKFDKYTVHKWRDALREAGMLPGLHLQDDANGNERSLVDQIVERIKRIIHKQQADLDVTDPTNPVVGITSQVQEVSSLLNPGSGDDVDLRVIVIFGPTGIGKTTIAKATYDSLLLDFKAEYCCFLFDVNTIFEVTNGKINLQNKLLSCLMQNEESQIRIDSTHQGIRMIERMIKNEKVLLVLDDVDNDEQLEVLGMSSRELFGRGSRIIVTTRDDSVVEQLEPDDKYKPRLLDEMESMKLFCLNAFGQDHLKEGYEDVSREAVKWGGRETGSSKRFGSGDE
ncbi:disease resistance protein RUN1-like [Rutidosis leptorrhynchoides]|uniref:disease resistance protein RUN1-like n=1 Tax=Rutidosis leptorrhynchoides TaxID=125765 RepID=UPI003A99A0A9